MDRESAELAAELRAAAAAKWYEKTGHKVGIMAAPECCRHSVESRHSRGS